MLEKVVNRQLFTMKFNSSRLKKFGYDIEIDYNKALENGEIIALSDSQMLRTIREVVVSKTGDKSRVLDRVLLEEFYEELNKIKKKRNSEENKAQIIEIKNKIIKMCFIPEYITIVMDDPSHYDYMFRNGVKINGVKYFRISTSAGQGRVSTVTFCSSEVLDAVNEILDNGRKKDIKFSPSKFNAYKGIYSSATKTVRTPRFCVVPDFESPDSFEVNWVTETTGENDDLIEPRTITRMYNRWDGMGLISPHMAKLWAEDLGIDYIPSQFCVRQSFIKGMLCVFSFTDFCEKKNNGNFMIKSIYKDKNGNNIEVDLREIDVILTESQFKLWNSYCSLEEYKKNCEKNNLKWGVSLYVDKELPTVLRMNYQFLQATNVPEDKIEELCEEFVDWLQGVNSENIYYSLLFLLGVDTSKSSIEKYLKHSENYWIKSLIVNHKLLEDKYIKKKIYGLIKTKIENACLGVINLTGNYQVIVSDPYGMMQYLCGHEVTGLISKGACYSKFWSDRGVNQVDCMRAPLTYRSEHVVLNIENTEEQQYWYSYCYGGIILNIHGHETDNFAGSDFDFDILATTSNKILIDSVYRDENPVVYEAPKPAKIIFTEEDLYKSDLFSFGSIIGAITNKSTSGFALLNNLEKEYGKDSREYKTTINRIKMCTKLQSAQIDK